MPNCSVAGFLIATNGVVRYDPDRFRPHSQLDRRCAGIRNLLLDDGVLPQWASVSLTQSITSAEHVPWQRRWAPHGLTLLRDPRARLLSAFTFRDGHIEPVDHSLKTWWRGNLSRYAAHRGVLGVQSKMLLGHRPFAQISPSELDSIELRVRAARVLLEDFSFVGLTEQFALSVRLYHAMAAPHVPVCRAETFNLRCARTALGPSENNTYALGLVLSFGDFLSCACARVLFVPGRSTAAANALEANRSSMPWRHTAAFRDAAPPTDAPNASQQLLALAPSLLAVDPDATLHAVGSLVFWHRVCHVYALLRPTDARCRGSTDAASLRQRLQRLRRGVERDAQGAHGEAALDILEPVLTAHMQWDRARAGAGGGAPMHGSRFVAPPHLAIPWSTRVARLVGGVVKSVLGRR